MSKTTEQRFADLKREVKEATREAERAQGALNETIKTLKEEFECETPREAKALLAQLEKKAEKAASEFETALDAYEAKWKTEDEDESED